MKWQLSEHVMVSCGQDCDACNYCDECNNNPLAPGPAERCSCGTNLNLAKTIFAGPTGQYCSMSCVEADIEAQILSLQELLSDRDAHFEEVDTESIGLRLSDEARFNILNVVYNGTLEVGSCARPGPCSFPDCDHQCGYEPEHCSNCLNGTETGGLCIKDPENPTECPAQGYCDDWHPADSSSISLMPLQQAIEMGEE